MLTEIYNETETRQASAVMLENWIAARPKARGGTKRADRSRLRADSWKPLDEVVSFYDYPLASVVGTNIKGWFDTCFWLSLYIPFLFTFNMKYKTSQRKHSAF